jgi:hypothetical protein
VIRRIAIVVPAADEEADIVGCLTALRTARRTLWQTSGRDIAVHIVVVLDRCRDRTPTIVARFPDVQAVRTSARCVGVARQLGARIALAAAGRSHDVWLANTDADSRVPPSWLTHIVQLAGRGAELMFGTVRPAVGLSPTTGRAWAARHSSGDGHPHVHGANLAIRADVHLALGGWRPLATGEDIDLATRASHRRISRTGAVPVVTSVRGRGRAPHGFSSYLRSLDNRVV